MRTLQNVLGAAFAGAAAVIVILAALLPLYLITKIDYAPTLVTNTIIEFTPPDNAIYLQNLLGALSFPFALMGGIMLIAMIGLPVGIVYALVKRISPPIAVVVAALLTSAYRMDRLPNTHDRDRAAAPARRRTAAGVHHAP